MAHSTQRSFHAANRFKGVPSAERRDSKTLRQRPKSDIVNNVLAFSKALEVQKSKEKIVCCVLN